MSAAVAERLLRLGGEVDAIAIVAADHPHVTKSIDALAVRGVPVIALISDLTAEARAGYVGLDNWKVARTAAWAITGLARQSGAIGILVGNHRYLCQDVCEMSFRSYFRERAAGFRLLEPVVTLEDDHFAYGSTLDLLRRSPDLVGLYVAGGGLKGALRALRELDTAQSVVAVGHDVTDETKSDLIDGYLSMAMSHPLRALAEATVERMIQATADGETGAAARTVIEFAIHTPENV